MRLSRAVFVLIGFVSVLMLLPTHRAVVSAKRFSCGAQSDNFNRANSGTLGANWTQFGSAGTNGPTVTSNQADQSDGFDSISWWSACSWGADQSAQITLTFTSSSGARFAGPAVRFSGATYNHVTGYYMAAYAAGWSVKYCNDGAIGSCGTQIATGSDTFSSGDIAKLSVTGTSFTAYKNGSSIATFSDSTIATGNAGFYFLNGGSSTTADDWSATDAGGGGPSFPAGILLNPLKGCCTWPFARR